MLELFLGQIPEAIFFALFMIYTKNIKEKRLLFIVLMITEYIILKQFRLFQYNMWFQIVYTFLTFTILKILYKEKAQITDIFTFTIASLILVILNIIFSPFRYINFIIYVIIVRIGMFLFLFMFKNKLNILQKIYKKFWNRNDKIKKKMKSVTFRSLNLVIFNIIFYIINIGMVYAIYYNSIIK